MLCNSNIIRRTNISLKEQQHDNFTPGIDQLWNHFPHLYIIILLWAHTNNTWCMCVVIPILYSDICLISSCAYAIMILGHCLAAVMLWISPNLSYTLSSKINKHWTTSLSLWCSYLGTNILYGRITPAILISDSVLTNILKVYSSTKI